MFDIHIILKTLIICGALIIGISSYKYFGYQEDNEVEECCEFILEDQLGIDIDLSPKSRSPKLT